MAIHCGADASIVYAPRAMAVGSLQSLIGQWQEMAREKLESRAQSERNVHRGHTTSRQLFRRACPCTPHVSRDLLPRAEAGDETSGPTRGSAATRRQRDNVAHLRRCRTAPFTMLGIGLASTYCRLDRTRNNSVKETPPGAAHRPLCRQAPSDFTELLKAT